MTAPRSAASRSGSTTSEVAPEWEIAIATSSGVSRAAEVRASCTSVQARTRTPTRKSLVSSSYATLAELPMPYTSTRWAAAIALLARSRAWWSSWLTVWVMARMSAFATTLMTCRTESSGWICTPTSIATPGAVDRPFCSARARRSSAWLASPMDWANRVTDACDTPARAASATAESLAASAGSASTVSATSRSAPVSRGATVRIRSVRSVGSVGSVTLVVASPACVMATSTFLG